MLWKIGGVVIIVALLIFIIEISNSFRAPVSRVYKYVSQDSIKAILKINRDHTYEVCDPICSGGKWKIRFSPSKSIFHEIQDRITFYGPGVLAFDRRIEPSNAVDHPFENAQDGVERSVLYGIGCPCIYFDEDKQFKPLRPRW